MRAKRNSIMSVVGRPDRLLLLTSRDGLPDRRTLARLWLRIRFLLKPTLRRELSEEQLWTQEERFAEVAGKDTRTV